MSHQDYMNTVIYKCTPLDITRQRKEYILMATYPNLMHLISTLIWSVVQLQQVTVEANKEEIKPSYKAPFNRRIHAGSTCSHPCPK